LSNDDPDKFLESEITYSETLDENGYPIDGPTNRNIKESVKDNAHLRLSNESIGKISPFGEMVAENPHPTNLPGKDGYNSSNSTVVLGDNSSSSKEYSREGRKGEVPLPILANR